MKILYCHCAYAQVVPKAVKQEVLRRLTGSGTAFDAVPDLCEMSARKDPALQRIAAEGDVVIAACYPRAVHWLFHAAGAPLPADRVDVVNMRMQTAEEVCARLIGSADSTSTSSPQTDGVLSPEQADAPSGDDVAIDRGRR